MHAPQQRRGSFSTEPVPKMVRPFYAGRNLVRAWRKRRPHGRDEAEAFDPRPLSVRQRTAAIVEVRSCRPSRRTAQMVVPMTKTVLIVEDNELNMKLFHDLLEAHGYDTVQTRSGLTAVALVRKHMPDLILMDIQLPEISGLDVTRELKRDPELRSIPVIAVTAFAMKGDEERIREGGCEAYLSKPISVAKFIETVRSYLGE